MEDRQPTGDDLPFLTIHYKLKNFQDSGITFEYVSLWEDSDWFDELDDDERNLWKYWTPVIDPEDG
jgi:hypothetical protein